MGFQSWHHTRLAHVQALLAQGLWARALLGLWTFYGISAAFRDEFLRPEEKQKFGLATLMRDALTLPWGWWVSIGLAILLAWAFEASFRLQRGSRDENDRLSKQIEHLEREATPGIEITFIDAENSSFFLMMSSPDGPPKYVAGVSVKNIGGTHLEHCRVQVRYKEAWRIPNTFTEQHARYISCPPFSLLPDEARIVKIFWREDERFNLNSNHLAVFNFAETKAGWKESAGTPILLPADYEMTVDVLTTQTRRASLNLGIHFENGEWVVWDRA